MNKVAKTTKKRASNNSQPEGVKKTLRGGVDPEVGKDTRIKPGEVRNPQGINNKRPWLTEVTEEMLQEKLVDPTYRKQYKESLWQNMISGKVVGAMTRDTVWDRTEGKVAQPVRVSGELTVSLAEEMRKARGRVAKIKESK